MKHPSIQEVGMSDSSEIRCIGGWVSAHYSRGLPWLRIGLRLGSVLKLV